MKCSVFFAYALSCIPSDTQIDSISSSNNKKQLKQLQREDESVEERNELIGGEFTLQRSLDATDKDLSNTRQRHMKKAVAPPCLVFGRNPIDRVVSYYYERCFKTEGCIGKGRYINDLSAEELYKIVASYRQVRGLSDRIGIITDEGMSNAACRALANEEPSRGLQLQVIREPDIVVMPRLSPPLTAQASAAALRNIEHCVVGLLERLSESRKVVAHWFPWLDFGNYTIRRTTFLYGEGKNVEALKIRQEHIDVILALNDCDVKLHKKMEELFEKQMEVLRNSSFLL
jgi:hypothetical protein